MSCILISAKLFNGTRSTNEPREDYKGAKIDFVLN